MLVACPKVSSAALLGLLITYGPACAADALTIASFGGQYTASQKKSQYEPFTASTGVTIKSVDYNGGLAELTAQVRSGMVGWDVVDVELQDLDRGCADGLFEKIDPAQLPTGSDGVAAIADFVAGSLHDCGVGTVIWSNVLAFSDPAFPGAKPSRIEDFFDLERFPGRRGLPKRPHAILEWALMADGVAPSEVYRVLAAPEGLDRAFAKLDTVKDHAVFWETGAQMIQLLADGEVALSAAYNGRVQSAISDDAKPLKIIWDRQIWNADYYAVVAGTGAKGRALDFIRFATDTVPLAEQTKYIAYGPVRRSSQPLIAPAIAATLPTAPANFNNALAFDAAWWTAHGDAINERYAAWLVQ
ncbi:putative spermidine/putrescine transport system substrate-binding protein [Angulomicrobium tetraedrale]|uniref:Putative spermidine/putrescine transport system substrate-binding protein n=1 Tax=Ancylobacter tetraedralis TaxID=217068 RepID=A0A839ZH70_9HYPH|nr:ABC transporter substrate-binding protein [Ancylobacter tetraedralis]MBB3774008.1 putative spermidine/putrescine transport system substrate-binding protein [Ancylobacter tetraedralis]